MNYYVRFEEDTFAEVEGSHVEGGYQTVEEAIKETFIDAEPGDIYDIVDGQGRMVGTYRVKMDHTKEVKTRKLPWEQPPERHHLMKYFDYGHLKLPLMKEVSSHFYDVATKIDEYLPESDQKTQALRHLLIGKDAAVRAAMDLERWKFKQI